tara:strand:+ start:114 stop:248 length:135 start_codon:yes stop_codon:yes gene_type:complete
MDENISVPINICKINIMKDVKTNKKAIGTANKFINIDIGTTKLK